MPANDQHVPAGFFSRWKIAILLFAAALVPIVAWGMIGAVSRFQNDVRQWLPKGFKEADDYAWFSKHFGVDEMVVISWEGCRLGNDVIEPFADRLLQRDPQGRRLFRKVSTGPQLVQRLQADPFGLTERAAIARLRGTLIGPDEETTAVIAWGTAAAADDRRAALNWVYQAAEEFGIDPNQLHLGGPTVDGATIDIESRRLLLNQSVLSIVLLIAAAYVRLKRIRLVFCTIGTGLFAGASSLAILYFTGGRMNLTLVMLPTLVFVLTVSASIHIVNYYWYAIQEKSQFPTERAVAIGWQPCVMAALTSIIGLVSLAASQVKPIRQFGIYSGLGLACSVPLILVLLPTLLHLAWNRRHRDNDVPVPKRFPWLDPLVSWICLWHRPVTIGLLTLTAVCAVGLTRLDSTVKIQNRFSARSRIIQDYRWLEEHLGPLVPLEIVLRFSARDPRNDWDRFQATRQVEAAISQSPYVLSTFSANTFRPVLPRGDSALDSAQRSLIIDAWMANREQWIDSGFIAEDRETGDQLWHITARVNAINDIDYGRFVGELKQQVESLLDKNDINHPEILFTGGIPLIYKAQRQILLDLASSFGWAFGVITLTFIVILRSLYAGLVAMLPNIFPPVVVIGSMGWLGWPLDIGSVMTASVALGMAVDGTFHYLTWFRRSAAHGGSRRTATRSAMRHCARALFDATVICALGVIPYAITTFLPTLRFATLLSVLMFVALFGDLVLLPSMLVGRLGSYFSRKKGAPGAETPPKGTL